MIYRILQGDCLDRMRELPEASVDAVVCDPPYGLGFMGKDWDSAAALSSRPPSADENDARFRNVFPRTGRGPAAVAFDGHAFQAWCEAWAREALRVLKPGGHLLAFGGTRTYHRLAAGIEDAGFEIRDTIAWMYGSGFPKSLDVSKAIDKAAPRAGMFTAFAVHFAERWEASGLRRADFVPHFSHYKNAESVMAQLSNWKLAKNVPTPRDFRILDDLLGLDEEWQPLIERVEAERAVIGTAPGAANGSVVGLGSGPSMATEYDVTAPATREAQAWEGWGTALKPSHEPVVVARKPLSGTVAGNVLAYGTGALNIDACRVESGERPVMVRTDTIVGANSMSGESTGATSNGEVTTQGRWPANVVLGHSEGCVPTGTRRVKKGGGRGDASRGQAKGDGWQGPDGSGFAVEHYDADGLETVTAWECEPPTRHPVYRLGSLTVVPGLSCDQDLEDFLAVALSRVRAGDSRSADTRTTPARAPADARERSSRPDSPDDYPSCPRCDGAHALLTAADDQPSRHLLADVLGSVLCPESSPRRSHDGSPASPATTGGSDRTSIASRTAPSRTAVVPPDAVASAERTPVDTTRTSPSPSPRGGLRDSSSASSTSEAFGEPPATSCRSGHRCSGFLPLVSACFASLREYVPLSVEYIERGGCPVRMLDEQTGELHSHGGGVISGSRNLYGAPGSEVGRPIPRGDSGGASRFFAQFHHREEPVGCTLDECTAVEPEMCAAHGTAAQFNHTEEPQRFREMLSGPPCTICGCATASNAEPSSSPSEHPIGSAPANAPAPGRPGSGDNALANERSAGSAEPSSTTTPATDPGTTAPPDALTTLVAQLARSAMSAVPLCGSCATATAQSAVATLRGHEDPSSQVPSLAGPGSTLGHKQPTPTLNPAPTAGAPVSSATTSSTSAPRTSSGSAPDATTPGTPASGTASGPAPTRFLYQSKPSSAERNAGLDGFEPGNAGVGDHRESGDMNERLHRGERDRVVRQNVHPTVKPIELMRWLIRLVIPPGGVILDPFLGSGSTGCAAVLERVEFIGIERDAEYISIAEARIKWWSEHPDGMTLVKRLEAESARNTVAESGQVSMFDLGVE